MDPTAATESAAARPAPEASLWPLVGALGAVLVVVGLVTYPVVFIFGIVVLLAAAIEWMVQAWSERASADADVQRRGPRARSPTRSSSRCSAAVGVGVVIYSFSRIMLCLSKTSGPVAVRRHRRARPRWSASSFAFRPRARRGAVAARRARSPLVGARRRRHRRRARRRARASEPHETTATLAAEGRVRHSRRDRGRRATRRRSVAAKANVTAEITLNADGTLVAKTLGVAGEPRPLDVTRVQPDQRAVPQRERRAAPARARPRHPPGGRRATATRSRRPRCRTSAARRSSRTAARQFLTFTIGVASCARRRRPYRVRRARRRRRRDRGGGAVSSSESRPASRADGAAHRVTRAVSCDAHVAASVDRRAASASRAAASLAWRCCSPAAPRTPRRTRGSRPARTPRRSRTCSGRCSSSPASSACIVFAAVGWCVIRYRDRGQAIPKQTHGKPALEIGLTILPALILIGVGDPHRQHAVRARQDRRHRVRRQRHRPAVVVGDRLPGAGRAAAGSPSRSSPAASWSSPTDTNVLVRGTSRDVIHSFWIPQAQRQARHGARPGPDAAPQADQPGIYAGQCAEFCGLSHANMRMEVVALDRRRLRDVEGQPARRRTRRRRRARSPPRARQTFIAQCSRCHQVNGLVDADGDPVIAHPRSTCTPARRRTSPT